MKSVGIIGGGIVGLAIAYKLGQQQPAIRITVFEKESAPGQHQSTHNSGVLHAGLYYKPGSAKARLAVSGLRQMLDFCRENGVPHEQCGKLVVATDDGEAVLLKGLFERGTANGLHGLRQLRSEDIQDYEPYARGVAAVHVPEEGIVDYAGVIKVLEDKVRAEGHRVLTGWKISRIERKSDQWLLHSTAGEETCDFIVNAAGLHSDRISRMAGERRETRIVPFRGTYHRLRKDRQHLVRNLVYPVANPYFPFLGVHFTRLVRGGIEAGPNAMLAFAREGYSKACVNVRDIADSVFFLGFWRFISRHWSMCWQELHLSFSRRLFAQALQRLVPELQEEDLEPGGAGVRAQAMRPSGLLVDDFHFIRKPTALHVLNAPSPAATASLAIADEITRQILA